MMKRWGAARIGRSVTVESAWLTCVGAVRDDGPGGPCDLLLTALDVTSTCPRTPDSRFLCSFEPTHAQRI